MAHLFRFQLPATALTATLLLACGGDKAESAPSSEAAKPAAAPGDAKVAPADGKTAPAAAAAQAPEVAGIPPAVDLSTLPALPGPKAEGNVPEDIAAADKAKDCKIVEGKLADCDAAEDAYQTATNNFVVAKAPAHVQTVFNLLAHDSPAVRVLVLDAGPLRYLDAYGDDIEDKAPLYRGLLAAAAKETDPGARSSFAWAVCEIPEDAVDGLTGILGAIAERYGADEEGAHIVRAIADRCGDDTAPCRNALLGVAGRNADPHVQLAALEKLEYMEPAPPADTWCPLVRHTMDTLEDESDLSTAIGLFTGETIDCAAHFDAWLSRLPELAKAGKLTYAELNAALRLADREDGNARIGKLRELGKQLQAVVGKDHDLRDLVDNLATLEAA